MGKGGKGGRWGVLKGREIDAVPCGFSAPKYTEAQRLSKAVVVCQLGAVRALEG